MVLINIEILFFFLETSAHQDSLTLPSELACGWVCDKGRQRTASFVDRGLDHPSHSEPVGVNEPVHRTLVAAGRQEVLASSGVSCNGCVCSLRFQRYVDLF